MDVRVEFTYEPKTNTTNIWIWNRFTLVDKRSIPEDIDWRRKRKIKDEITKEYKDKT